MNNVLKYQLIFRVILNHIISYLVLFPLNSALFIHSSFINNHLITYKEFVFTKLYNIPFFPTTNVVSSMCAEWLLLKHTLNFFFHMPFFPSIYSLNCHSCLHIGQSCWWSWEFNHFKIQWIWKTWEHFPHTETQNISLQTILTPCSQWD